MAKKKTTKGKRYTAEEKQEVIDYVISVDGENGRGGVAAAARTVRHHSPHDYRLEKARQWRRNFCILRERNQSRSNCSITSPSPLGRDPRPSGYQGSEIEALNKEYAKLKKKV